MCTYVMKSQFIVIEDLSVLLCLNCWSHQQSVTFDTVDQYEQMVSSEKKHRWKY